MAATLADADERGGGESGRSKSRRPIWLRLLIIALVILYALLFGEMFLRMMKPQALIPRYVTGGPEGVRANMPGVEFRQWTPEVDVTLRYNAAGMRDDRPPPPLQKAPGECRIALLGDSYFVGFESRFEDSFAKRLEEELARRGTPCRVLNFAVSGFGHAEMLATLESRVRPWSPDLMLVSVHSTDGFDNLRANLFQPGPQGLEPTGRSFLPGVAISDRLNEFAVYRWAQENSHLYSAGREWAGGMGKRLLAIARVRDANNDAEETAGGEAPDADEGSETPGYVASQALNQALVLQLAREAEVMGSRMMLFEIPMGPNRRWYGGPARHILGDALLEEIPYASPLDTFLKMRSPDVQLYMEKGHRHWTPLGSKVAARVAADAILAQQLLPQPQSMDASVGSPSSTLPASS